MVSDREIFMFRKKMSDSIMKFDIRLQKSADNSPEKVRLMRKYMGDAIRGELDAYYW